MPAKLSVNINKVALLRNSREGNFPDLLKYARDCEEFGAEGITVHPRPDERHVRYSDILPLKAQTLTEFNIEGNPNPKFLKMVLDAKPHQCTLVPDSPDALTSDHGWDTKNNKSFLQEVCTELRELEKHAEVAKTAQKINIGVNAGHDLNLDNLKQYAEAIPNLLEVSIGHALTIDAIYFGLQNAIAMYKNLLK